MENYLLKYLYERADNPRVKKNLDYFKVNLDGRIYAYGDNMNPYYPEPQKQSLYCVLKDIKTILNTKTAKHNRGGENNVLSLVRIPDSVPEKYGLNIIGSILSPASKRCVKTPQLIKDYFAISTITRRYDYNRFLSEELCNEIERIKRDLIEEYKKYNFKAIFVGNGEPFINKLHIDVSKELNIPSFIFLHGIPGIYNLDTEKRADYLLVWGEQIKLNYENVGFDKERIFVTGSPKVQYKENHSLRHSLEDVLVTTSSSVEWSPFGWDYSNFPFNDRSLIVLYCYFVQDALLQLGVKKARLRLHPSVGKNWINHFIDNSFYKIDDEPLQQSLGRSSLEIGPT